MVSYQYERKHDEGIDIMSIRKYHSDVQMLLAEGQELMLQSDGSKFFNKVFAVNLVLVGQTAANVAKAAGLCRSTVSDWVKTADEEGFQSLREKPRPGRSSRLSQEQYNELEQILQKSPEEFGYRVWDGNALSDLIQRQYGVTLRVRRCQYIFHELGFSRIRPQTFPSKQYEHTEERKNFQKKWKKSGKTSI